MTLAEALRSRVSPLIANHTRRTRTLMCITSWLANLLLDEAADPRDTHLHDFLMLLIMAYFFRSGK